MISKKTKKNSYKGLLLNFYYDIKKTIIIGIIITLSITLFSLLLNIILIQFNEPTSSNSGMLVVGFFVMLISLFIYVINSTSKVELFSKFSFPINRLIYAISNFIAIVIGSFLMLMVITIMTPIEVLLTKFISIFTIKLLYLNNITLYGYIVGFLSAWGYMIALGSITYCIFMYIRKYKIFSLLVLALLITLILSFGWLGNILQFIFFESNLALLMIKLLSISIVTNILGYIPLKKMEVA